MNTTSSSTSRGKAYAKCAFWMFICIGFLMFVVPYLYSFSSTLNNYLKTLDEHDIHPGAIYYSDVPVTMDTELANREAVKQAIEMRAARIKN